MAGQTVTRVPGQDITLAGYSCKDANGNAAVGITVTMHVVSGDPTGLSLDNANSKIHTLKPGTYTITLTATNAGGSVTSDAAGDTDGTADTIVLTDLPPTSQSWTYA